MGDAALCGEVLVAGEGGEGEALVLSEPISFWGGVDPASGKIVDVRHPEFGASIAGKVLFLSGYAPESFSHMLEQYPVHYMSKPVTMEQLVGRVKELLAAA